MEEEKKGYEENEVTEATEKEATETERTEKERTETEATEVEKNETETNETTETAEKDHAKTDPKDATDPKKKWSIFGLLGFGISVITWIVIIIYVIVLTLPNGEYGGNLMGGVFWGSAYYAIPALIAYIVSIVLSIIGIIRSRKKKQRGRGFGVWGILISVIGVGINLVAFAGVIGILVEIATLFGSRSHAPYRVYSGERIRYDNYDVQMKDHLGQEQNEGALMKYYWSGDPEDTEIRPESIDIGEAKITGIGYFLEAINGPAGVHHYNFSVDLPEDKKFSGFNPGNQYIPDPQEHLEDYGIEPGTRVIFDEIEFHVFVPAEVEWVCATFSDFYATPTPKPDPAAGDSKKMVPPNYLVMENDDGSITFYRYYLFFECAEGNEYFYSDEYGQLRPKSDDLAFREEVDFCLYRTNDGFESFETVYEGE